MKKLIIGIFVVAVLGAGVFVVWRLRAAAFTPPPPVSRVRFLDPYTKVYQTDDPKEGKSLASDPGYFPVPQGLVNPLAEWKKWEARVVHTVFYVQDTPFADYDPNVPSPLFKVNQVGYLPHAPKFAYVGAWLGPTYGAWRPKKPMTGWELVDEKSGKAVPLPGGNGAPRLRVLDGVTKEGVPFTSDEGKLNPKAKWFDIIRDNTDWEHGEKLHLVGGWHDAADYDRRPMHLDIVNNLCAVYLMRPQNFRDGQLAIPENANGIPDILDEAGWGLRHLLAGQQSDGGVGTWIESVGHPGPGNIAEKDEMKYALAQATRRSSLMYAAHQITGDQKYLDAISIANDFHNGCNPQGATLTSGLGEVYPVAFLDLPSYVDKIVEYVPGITPYRWTYAIPKRLAEMVWGGDRKRASAWPIWRRWGNLENQTVAASEYTVWETIAPAAAATGYLISPEAATPPQPRRPPAQKLSDLPGYWLLP